MQPTPNVLGAPANGLLGRWGGSKYNQLNPTALSGMTAWYDVNERNTLFVDASGRTSVVSNRAEDGGDRFLYLNGASGTYASTPDSAALSITGDIDIRAQIAFANATPNTYQTFIGKWTTTGNQFAYSLDIAANNRINLYWSTNGSNALLVQSTVAPTFVVNQPIWIRATLDVDNGSGGYSVQFFTSSDGSSWTQLGSTVTQAGVTSIFDSTAILEIGSNRVGSTDRMSGRFYRAQIYNGINGTLAFDANFTTHTTGSAPLTESANGAVVSFLGNARVTYVGPTNCLCLNGVSGNFAGTPDAAFLRVDTFLFAARVRLPDYSPASNMTLVSKRNSGALSYDWILQTTGIPTLNYSTDGSTVLTADATTALATADFAAIWMAVTRDSATGAVKHYWQADTGSNTLPLTGWTQLGTTVAGTSGALFQSTQDFRIGATFAGGTQNRLTGNVFVVHVLNGYDFAGSTVLLPNFTTAPKLANSFTATTGQTVTINSSGDLGARIAGEKDLVQLTLTKQPIYLPWSGENYGYVSGQSGAYFSTPDAVANSITGDQTIIARVSVPSFTAATTYVAAKWLASGNQRAWQMTIQGTTGNVRLTQSTDGTASTNFEPATSLTTTGLVAGQPFWLAATLDVDNGAAGRSAKIYYSASTSTTPPSFPSGWTQLGSTVTQATAANTFDSSSPVELGVLSAGGTLGGAINHHYVDLRNGYDGAGSIVAAFNPSRYTSGTAVLDGSVSTQSLVLDGSSGCDASTPDSAATSITGDIELIANLALDDWTPSGEQCIISKWSTPGQRSYILAVNTSGALQFYWSNDGTAALTLTSSASVPAVDRASTWVRVSFDVNNGAGGRTATFFTSSDGSNWVQLGTPQTSAGATSIFDSTASVIVGRYDSTSSRLSGRVFRAQVLNGINGTIAFDANFAVTPSLTATSFTESSSNAATVTLNGTATIGPKWTLNGGSTIVNRTSLYFDGSDDYMKAPAFALSQPETVYFVGQQVSWTSADRLWDGNTDESGRVTQVTGSPQIGLFAGAGLPNNSNWPVATTAVVSCVINGASSSLGVNRTTRTTGNAGSSNMNGFTLGTRGDATGNYGNIRTNEVAIYAAAQDTSTQNRWALYAGKKWGFNA